MLKQKDKKILLATLLTLVITLPLTETNAAPGGKKGGHRGPPPEAIEACADKTENDMCGFTTPRGDEIEGSCIVPPRGEESLICAPEGGPPPPPQVETE